MTHPAVQVRSAVPEDCEKLLAWRNEPQTRAMSVDQSEITLDAHRPWFMRSLENPRRLLLIGSLVGQPGSDLGLVRFDLAEDGRSAEAGINLAAAYHGQRLSAPLLAAGLLHFEQLFPDVHLFRAKIRPENAASLRCFRACGFLPAAPADSTPGVSWFERSRSGC